MSLDEQQGQWIIGAGHAAAEQVRAALQGPGSGDLCARLVAAGAISDDTARLVRARVLGAQGPGSSGRLSPQRGQGEDIRPTLRLGDTSALRAQLQYPAPGAQPGLSRTSREAPGEEDQDGKATAKLQVNMTGMGIPIPSATGMGIPIPSATGMGIPIPSATGMGIPLPPQLSGEIPMPVQLSGEIPMPVQLSGEIPMPVQLSGEIPMQHPAHGINDSTRRFVNSQVSQINGALPHSGAAMGPSVEGVAIPLAGAPSSGRHGAFDSSGVVPTPGRAAVFESDGGSPSDTPQIPGYEIIDEIGRGGMGVVLRARQLSTAREVVIKVILGDDPGVELLVRFEREAKALARFKHPNIVRVYDYNCAGAHPYIVMDRVKGRNLKQHVDDALRTTDGVPSFEWTSGVFAAIASALGALHEEGVFHRDLKPENILIDEDSNRPVLVDFGLAKMSGEEAGGVESLTQTGLSIGTPAYMPPEQLDPNGIYGRIGSPADVWGLGGTLFYCLTGRPPYEGATAVNIYKQLVESDPPPVHKLKPETPRWLSELCGDCLQKPQERRPKLPTLALAFEDRNYNAMERPMARSTVISAAIAAALLLISSLLFFGLRYAANHAVPQQVVLAQGTPSLVKRDNLVLEGHLADGLPGLVYIRRVGGETLAKAKANDEGRFKIALALDEGETQYELFTRNPSGLLGGIVRGKAILDTQAPSIELTALPTELTPALEISGKLSEEACLVSLAGVELRPGGLDFKFSLPETMKLPPVLELIARDAAGNETKRRLPIRIVDRAGNGTHGELGPALEEIPPGTTVFLRPGEYVAPTRLTKGFRLIGQRSGKRRATLIARKGPLLIDLGEKAGRITMRGVALLQEDTKADLLVLRSGQVELQDCELRSKGSSALRVAGVAGGLKTELKWKGGTIYRVGDHALIVDQGRCLLDGVKVVDDHPLGAGQSLIQEAGSKRRTGAIEVREGGLLVANNCQVAKARDRAFIVKKGGRLEGERTTISIARAEGISLKKGELMLRRWTFKGCGDSGIKAERPKTMKLVDCIIEKCGAKVRGSDPGLSIDGGAVEINDCKFIGNSGAGIKARRGAQVSIADSRIEGNVFGILCQSAGAKLTRCVLTGNDKAGALASGSGARIILNDCQVAKNRGPGAASDRGGTLLIPEARITGNGLGNSGNTASGVWIGSGGALQLGQVSFTKNAGYGLFIADRSSRVIAGTNFDLHFKDNKLGDSNSRIRGKR